MPLLPLAGVLVLAIRDDRVAGRAAEGASG
jgi:hypothetical protein